MLWFLVHSMKAYEIQNELSELSDSEVASLMNYSELDENNDLVISETDIVRFLSKS